MCRLLQKRRIYQLLTITTLFTTVPVSVRHIFPFSFLRASCLKDGRLSLLFAKLQLPSCSVTLVWPFGAVNDPLIGALYTWVTWQYMASTLVFFLSLFFWIIGFSFSLTTERIWMRKWRARVSIVRQLFTVYNLIYTKKHKVLWRCGAVKLLRQK